MSDIIRKKRSRTGLISHVNKLVKTDIQAIYDNYEEDKFLSLKTFKTVLEEQLQKITALSEEIQAEIEDDEAFQEDFDKYTDATVSIRHDISILNNFIAEKVRTKDTSSQRVSSSKVKLPKF